MRNKALTSIKFIAIVCLFAVFSSALFLSSDSFALNLTDQVILVRGNMSYNFASPANLSDCNFSNYNSYLGNPNSNLTCYIRSITLELPSEQYASSDYLYVPLYVFNNANNNGSDAFLSNLSTSTPGLDLVSVEFNQLSASSGLANLIFKVYTAGNYSTIVLTSTTGNAFSTLHEGEYLASGKATHYRPIGQVDTQSIVNAINNQTDYTQNLNNIRNDIQGLSDAQEQANDDANDRYQDEKDTIQNNMDQAQDSADSFNPSFSLPNPFSAFAEKFGQQDCSTFPNLQSWLKWHGSNQICSPWPSSIKTVMNGVTTFLLALLITRFLVAWFKKNDTGD